MMKVLFVVLKDAWSSLRWHWMYQRSQSQVSAVLVAGKRNEHEEAIAELARRQLKAIARGVVHDHLTPTEPWVRKMARMVADRWIEKWEQGTGVQRERVQLVTASRIHDIVFHEFQAALLGSPTQKKGR